MGIYKTDIVIFGGGIAGLWLHHLLRRHGYKSLLLETGSIGGVQSIASQGILHSGLKYSLAGKVNKLAQSISAMPDRWRAALQGRGDVDLSLARMSATSQLLMIPDGFMGGLVKIVAEKALGDHVHDIARSQWPDGIAQSGFKGRVVAMGEPVLDIPSVVRALATPYRDSIRHIDMDFTGFEQNSDGGIESIWIDDEQIIPRNVIFTAAQSNLKLARQMGHDDGLKTQHRPLVQGMLRGAPFDCYAHLVGASDKPVATITTHYADDGQRIWYIGAAVAEREKTADPFDVKKAMDKAFSKYMPSIDVKDMQWSVLPIDRVEGASNTESWMPDTPTIHRAQNCYYCWPTKLTFAPMLGDKILDFLSSPSDVATEDWSFLSPARFADTPWDACKEWQDG